MKNKKIKVKRLVYRNEKGKFLIIAWVLKGKTWGAIVSQELAVGAKDRGKPKM